MTGGNKSRTKPKSKKRSAARVAQFDAFVRKQPAPDKENVPPALVPPPPTKPCKPTTDWKESYQKLRRKYRTSLNQQRKLEASLADFKLKDAATKHSAELSSKRIAELSAIMEKFLVEGQKKSADSTGTTDALRKQIKALKQRVRRSIRGFSRAVARAKEKSSICRLTQKGIYTAQARKLARITADGGCARGKIGPMMEHIGAIFGVRIDRAMSRKTVGRAIEEGGVAAKMQLAFELSLNHGTLRLSYLPQLFS
jgi:hypothetical protein